MRARLRLVQRRASPADRSGSTALPARSSPSATSIRARPQVISVAAQPPPVTTYTAIATPTLKPAHSVLPRMAAQQQAEHPIGDRRAELFPVVAHLAHGSWLHGGMTGRRTRGSGDSGAPDPRCRDAPALPLTASSSRSPVPGPPMPRMLARRLGPAPMVPAKLLALARVSRHQAGRRGRAAGSDGAILAPSAGWVAAGITAAGDPGGIAAGMAGGPGGLGGGIAGSVAGDLGGPGRGVPAGAAGDPGGPGRGGWLRCRGG